jgi:putative membrane protein
VTPSGHRRGVFERPASRPLLLVLGLVLLVEFLVLAWTPVSRSDWLLENLLVVLLVGLLVLSYKRFRLSRLSYVLLFCFLAVHEIGAHYTYAQVPYDAFFQRVLGWSPNESFGFERNQFDRLAHFLYGLTFVVPIRELFMRVVDAKGIWSYVLPLDVTVSTSALYELIEWQAAILFGGDLGAAYLGIQGDVWDAQRDMALAGLGALIAMCVTFVVQRATRRDFARELAESLKVKRADP